MVIGIHTMSRPWMIDQHVGYVCNTSDLKKNSSLNIRDDAGTWNVEKDPDGSEDHCFLRLEQSLALSVPMPPPFDRILKFITCRQVRTFVMCVSLLWYSNNLDVYCRCDDAQRGVDSALHTDVGS